MRGREGGAADGEMGAVTVVEVWSRFGTSWIFGKNGAQIGIIQ